MDLGIAGKTTLVLGGGGGLGRAIAIALAHEGVQVALAGRGLERLTETRAIIEGFGGQASCHAWDLADVAAIDGQIASVEDRFGGIDILVNNTGGPPPTPVSGQPSETWSTQFRSMVLSVIALTDRVLPGMRERGWGRIITSASSGVIAPIANLGLSNSLRSALVGWSKTLAREVALHGITANVVVPGRIYTARVASLDDMRAQREGRTAQEIRRDSEAAIPLGRYGDPEEYGAAVAFLASRQAAYITGSVLRVDGGLLPNI